jgi:hypothetical protein
MWMPGKPGHVVGGIAGVKVIKEQKGIQIWVIIPEGSKQPNPCPLNGGLAFPDVDYLASAHSYIIKMYNV